MKTVQEILDNLAKYSDSERGDDLNPLIDLFSPVSKQMLIEFQAYWNPNRSYSEFRKEQDEIIRLCVEMEISPLGDSVRKLNKLPAFTLDTLVR